MDTYSSSVDQEQQQKLPIEDQKSYSTSPEIGAGGPTFTEVFNIEENREEKPATMSEDDKSSGFIRKSITVILGSTSCLFILCVLLVVPILELAIGAAYRNQCPFNPNIPVYLIVTGACGIATIVLTIAIVVAFIYCIKQNSDAATFATGCVICLIVLVIVLMSSFLFIWFIVGNVWIFGAKSTVDLNNSLSSNYCQPTLYQFAFWILIVSYIMMGVGCFCSCICPCVSGAVALKLAPK